MSNGKSIIGIVGSPNKDGRTNEHVVAALEGCKRKGAQTELIQLSDHVVEPCHDCLPWVCKDELHCTYEDPAFEFLTEKLLSCSGLVFGTPIYWWDLSAMVKYLILKMFRVFAMTSPANGIPALGIGIAGGTGNGLATGLKPLYHFFQMMQMRPLEPVPVTRFNYDACLERSGKLGEELVVASENRVRFKGREESLDLYDRLPYINMSRAEERRLLANLITLALPEEERKPAATGLAEADVLAAEGQSLRSAKKISEVYNHGLKRHSELNS